MSDIRTIRFSTGLRAAELGEDLATVARQLDAESLAFWIERFSQCPLYHELDILRAEAERRNADWLVGPLWR